MKKLIKEENKKKKIKNCYLKLFNYIQKIAVKKTKKNEEDVIKKAIKIKSHINYKTNKNNVKGKLKIPEFF